VAIIGRFALFPASPIDTKVQVAAIRILVAGRNTDFAQAEAIFGGTLTMCFAGLLCAELVDTAFEFIAIWV
jgi:hypothetical protein